MLWVLMRGMVDGKTMSEKDKRLQALDAILAIAWADGEFHKRELLLTEKLVQQFGLKVGELRPPEKRVPLVDLLTDRDERLRLYQSAYQMSVADGRLTPPEWKALEQLREALALSEVDVASVEERINRPRTR